MATQETPIFEPRIIESFDGGMNLFHDDHRIAPNEYGEGYNVRTRRGPFEAVKQAERDTNAPAGFKQGLFGFGDYLLLFNSGSVYWKNVTILGDTWHLILGVNFSVGADRIYTQAVPASTLNFERKLDDADKVDGSASSDRNVSLNSLQVNGTISGLVCQDGVSIPRIVYISGGSVTGRALHTYAQWTTDDREYVPIGKQMAFINGILLIVKPDDNIIYRSVSGRPLDFVVNVDVNGNKGGDASTTSYAASYDPITGIWPLNSGELLVATDKVIYPLDFDYESTIFGEPTFRNIKQKIVGILNQFSFVDGLNDYYFIDKDGFRSYSAVSALNSEGRNSIFSQMVSNLLTGLKQPVDSPCTFVFDNYAFFSCLTTSGHVVLVYDMLTEKWVSIDTYGIGAVKQFAAVSTDTSPRLYCITDAYVYELFASDAYLTAQVNFGAITSGNARNELKPTQVRAIFTESTGEDEAVCTLFANGKRYSQKTAQLTESFSGIPYPATYPVSYADNELVDPVNFNFEDSSRVCWKFKHSISWDNGAKLNMIQFDAELRNAKIPLTRAKTIYAS